MKKNMFFGGFAVSAFLLSCSLDPYGEGLGSNSTGGDTSIIIPNIEIGSGGGDDNNNCTKPSAPNGVSASVQSSSSIRISWNSVSGASYYKVYRASAYGTYSNIGTAYTASYTNTGLSSSTTYYYKVTAVNSCGESALSSSYDYATTNSSSSTGTPNAVEITLTSYKENGTHDLGWFGDGAAADPRIWFDVISYSSSGTVLLTTQSETLLSLNDPANGSWTGSKTGVVSISPSAYRVSVRCVVKDYDNDLDGSQDISPSESWSYYPISEWLNQSQSHTAGTSSDGCIVKYTVKFIRR